VQFRCPTTIGAFTHLVLLQVLFLTPHDSILLARVLLHCVQYKLHLRRVLDTTSGHENDLLQHRKLLQGAKVGVEGTQHTVVQYADLLDDGANMGRHQVGEEKEILSRHLESTSMSIYIPYKAVESLGTYGEHVDLPHERCGLSAHLAGHKSERKQRPQVAESTVAFARIQDLELWPRE
jgi:hypothetical protein